MITFSLASIYRGTSPIGSPPPSPDHRTCRAIGTVDLLLGLRALRLLVTLRALSRTAVERMWHIYNSQGQLMALAFQARLLNTFQVVAPLLESVPANLGKFQNGKSNRSQQLVQTLQYFIQVSFGALMLCLHSHRLFLAPHVFSLIKRGLSMTARTVAKTLTVLRGEGLTSGP